MSDHTMFFDELLVKPNLRSKTYQLCEAGGKAVVEMSGRQEEHWFFARKWVELGAQRSMLYHVLDEIEARGWRFAVRRVYPCTTTEPERPWGSAKAIWASLTPDELAIHKELFPEEKRLIDLGYDWDDEKVSRHGEEIPVGSEGRRLEERDGIVYEWVIVPDEYTWRRFPLTRFKNEETAPMGAME